MSDSEERIWRLTDPKEYEDPPAILDVLIEKLRDDHVLDYEGYDDWLMEAGDILIGMDRPIAAAFTYLARSHRQGALRLLPAETAPIARAFVLERHKPKRSADLYLRQGCFARAARTWERVGEWAEAAEAWENAVTAYQDAERVTHGWALLGLAKAQLRVGEDAEATFDTGLMLLAQDAVQAESQGDTLRAIEHYQTLRDVGEVTGLTEHLLEGAINEARLYEAEGDAYSAFSVRAHAAEICAECNEHHAAAVLYQEAARSAEGVQQGASAVCWARAAEAWAQAAKRVVEISARLAENALLGRLDALNHCGHHTKLADTYRALAMLPLKPEVRDRYLHLAEALPAHLSDAELEAMPRLQLARRHWAAPLFAHEMGASPRDALLECTSFADSIIARRRATRALISLEAYPDKIDSLILVAKTLGENENVLSTERVLLNMVEHQSASVRTAAIHGLARRRGTKVARVLVKTLNDEAVGVRSAGLECLTAEYRPEAIGPAVTLALGTLERGALQAVRWLGTLPTSDCLNPLYRVGQRAPLAAVRDLGMSYFERRCPSHLRAMYDHR